MDGMVRVIEPARLDTQVRLTASGAELRLTGQAGERYRVEASTDLREWALLCVETAGVEPIAVQDTTASQFRQHFYRAVPEP
jgi:hypothetical protein